MEISEIKQRLKIEDVLRHYGIKPGKHNQINCPFHKDDRPSLKIYPETNSFNCFGCGASGDVIEFIQLKEKLNKHQALLKATELCGSIPIESIQPEKPKQAEKKTANHTKILTKIFTTFRNGLKSATAKHPKAYMESRNLSIEKTEAGYNSGQFHHRGKLSIEEQEACKDAGLLIPYTGTIPKRREANYKSFAKDCIIYPLKNESGQIVSLYGRSIKEGTKSKHYYLKGRQGLYPGYPAKQTTRLILTEAIIDAASLLQIDAIKKEYGILSLYGVNGLTTEHKKAIQDLTKLKEIILFFDGDKAGNQAIEKYGNELQELMPDVNITYVETPDNEDINSLLITYEQEIFPHLLENRKELFLLTEPGVPADNHKDITKVSAKHTEASSNSPTGELNTTNPDFITYQIENLQVIILGGIDHQQLDRMRVTLKISRTDSSDPLHSIRHSLDLYNSSYVEKFIQKATEQLETGILTLKRAIAEMTGQLEDYRLKRIESLKEKKPGKREITPERYKRAVNYLKAPGLMERTGRDIGRSGMIGEETNRLLMYLVFTSRLREHPLHIISLGASGTGKTYLQEKVSQLIPEDHKIEITILSENAFYYFGQRELKNKLVLIEDMDGAENVLYPLRELQSKKKISKTIPIKDSKGNLKTITMKVEGPICLAGTTTREKLYEDNANRSLLIYLDTAEQHKEHIMKYQRKLSAGKIDQSGEHHLIEHFKDMQSILKPVKVRNPYAEYLVIPKEVFKPLRTNTHYLAFIETITFYHQYQRELKTDPGTGERYIETSLEDIEWANKLLKDVLLSKSDELSGQCRRFFESLKSWLRQNNTESFYKSQIREALRMNPNNLKYYISQLLKYNYLKIVGGNPRKSGFEYQVINTDEYSKLEGNITNVLDSVLEDLKKTVVGNVDNRWVTGAVIHSTN